MHDRAYLIALFVFAGFGDLYPVLNGLYVTYLVAGLALVFMNIVMVKNFVDQIFFVLQRELGLL